MTAAAPLLVVAIVSAGCATSLTVNSTPPGAKILIDGKDTGLRTPDSFTPRKLPGGGAAAGGVGAGPHTRENAQLRGRTPADRRCRNEVRGPAAQNHGRRGGIGHGDR